MRPILLQGHTRSLTQIKYNREGDLLFSVSKDKVANVWYSHNGERLGTYSGHQGAVWTIDVNCKYYKIPNVCSLIYVDKAISCVNWNNRNEANMHIENSFVF